MPITMADIGRLKETEFEQGIVETFVMESDLARLIPLETIGTTQVNTRRTNALPSVGWRKRGERFTGGNVGYEVVSDAVYHVGAEITIDKIDMRDKSPFVNPLAYYTDAHVKAMAYEFNDKVINGDHATDEDEPEGLKVRIGNLASSQTVYGVSSGAELDVRPGTADEADAQALLYKIDMAKYALDGHGGGKVIALTNADFIQALKNALRVLNIYVDPTKPSTGINERATSNTLPSGRSFMWDNIEFIDVGPKADQTTPVVGTTTVNSQACRDVYFVKLDTEKYFHGIQEYPMEISKPFMLDDGLSWRVVIDWPVGFRHVHPKFASRLLGVRVA